MERPMIEIKRASEKTIKDTTSNTYDNVIVALPSGV